MRTLSLRRAAPIEVPVSPFPEQDGATSVLAELYQQSVQEAEPRIVALAERTASLRGVDHPSTPPGMVPLEGAAFLDSDPTSWNLAARLTGKLALLHYVEAKEALSDQPTDTTDLIVADLRAAPGRVMFEAARREAAEEGRVWPFDGCERMIALFRSSKVTKQMHYQAGLTDNDPINEILLSVQQSKKNPNQYNYEVGMQWTPILEDEIMWQTEGRRRIFITDPETGKQVPTAEFGPSQTTRRMTVAGIFLGIKVHELLAKYKVTNITLLPAEVLKEKGLHTPEAQQDAQDALQLVPKSNNSSFTYRMMKMQMELNNREQELKAQGLLRNGKNARFENGSLTDEAFTKISNKIIMAACYEHAYNKLSELSSVGNGIFARIGIIDITDPSQEEIIQALRRQLEGAFEKMDMKFDYNDPNHRNMIHGAIYIKYDGNLPGVMTKSNPGSKEASVIKGLDFTSVNHPMGYSPHKGFRFTANAFEEILTGKIGGMPLMPGLLPLISLPAVKNELGEDEQEVLMPIDLMNAPGIFMEAFLSHHDVFRPYRHKAFAAEEQITIRGILTGEFIGKLGGRLARAGHALLKVCGGGDNRREDGVHQDFTFASLITFQGIVRGFVKARRIDLETKSLVPNTGPKPLELIEGRVHAVVPRTPSRLPVLSARQKQRTHTLLPDNVHRQHAAEGKSVALKWEQVLDPTQREIFRVIADARGRVHLYAYGEEEDTVRRLEAARAGSEYPDIPIVTGFVMSHGTKDIA